MIIVGWGHRSVKNYGPMRKTKCRNCFNERMWLLQRVRYWITFFFIPIIPYRTEYILICPICRIFDQLKKKEFEQHKTASDKMQVFIDSQFDDETKGIISGQHIDTEIINNKKDVNTLNRSKITTPVRKMDDVRSENKQEKS